MLYGQRALALNPTRVNSYKISVIEHLLACGRCNVSSEK